MPVKLSIRDLQEQLPELLDRAATTGEEFMVQRNGKDYAVVVGARQWKRRSVGKRLDAHDTSLRLAPQKQARAEELLVNSKDRRLTRTERRELDALLRECDEVTSRRAKAMSKLL